MAITRLWFFTLRPSISATDQAFTQLWTDVLELCAAYTPSPGPSSSQVRLARLSTPCPDRPHHFLFQTTPADSSSPAHQQQQQQEGRPDNDDGQEEEPVFVLISSYPSLALCSQADAAYAQRHRARMMEFVRHRALRQMDLEDAEVVAALLSSPRAPPGPPVTVNISNRDPLRSEVAEVLSSPLRGATVPPLDEEISGADTYEIPVAPVPAADGDGDVFAAQRGEGRKFIRISRREDAGGGDGDDEVFRLRELLSR